MQALLSGHYEASRRRAGQYPVALAVLDTTSLNYSAHRATEQLGPIGDGKSNPHAGTERRRWRSRRPIQRPV
jgi:hypothetical protein